MTPADDDAEFRNLYSELLTIREILHEFAGGNFDSQVALRGAVAGYLKTLQANLRHLAWQVEQVAEGDFSQRVDFMGNFSTAFNSLTLQLEHSMAEQKEREASERTQIMLDATPLCCSLLDENMNVIDCNLEAVKLFDLKDKQEYLNRFYDLSPEYQPDGNPSVQLAHAKLKEAFENERAVFEWLHQNLAGEPIPSEITLVRVHQKDHYIVAAYTRDLRELKKTQNALERERLLLLDIMNTSPVCFTIIIDDVVKFVNPFMHKFFGIEIGEELSDYLLKKEMLADIEASFYKEEGINWRPVTMRTKTGEIKEMLSNAFAVNFFGDEGVMIWLVDVTQIREIEADLRKAKETAEDLARVKGDFLANMSHEIRTPMNAIIGMMHLLHNTNLDIKQKTYIGTAEKSAQLLLRIINDILDFSKIEAGKLTMEEGLFSVQNAVREVAAVEEDAVLRKGLQLNVNIAPDIPELLVGDALRLKQVLLNLLSNAIKFTPAGSISIQLQLQEQTPDKVTLVFRVIDTGIGMAWEEQQKLFMSFSQVDSSITRKYGGTGLGLAISKSLVEMMHGRMGCTSEKDKGSTFFFTADFNLPTPKAAETNAAAGRKHDVVIPERLRGLPILLAEDNLINQMVATELLASKGFAVDVADNGREAIAMLQQKPYGLVLMDIQMPEMDGLQAIRLIRQMPRFKDLPVLAMTANAMGGDREMCLAAGMNDHIAKPIDPPTLYKSIIKWARPVNRQEDH